mmetsp:Transcript_26426/g.74371  ORF Transcript_26426/g.74371 Transcript_26426/m.74371 type:complete len:118 (+) Transcript_26426:1536-1889(+)|eukprot:CAMPEP_0117661328 /NCGR_PEP_ID=MMETSP0804-20121206/7479_1 /TAXON_ID=1074897 /ORGANISM="Tetraselmis astigmatica, Strain CCMP880" /LENGTH=117 /DNA_ID=CAMNT_0005468189 /DNA_START=539 /DNA_END=892 /DNA_ORIENTATION=+
MFLPFVLGVLHSYGWFNWIKKEWVTFRFWKKKVSSWIYGEPKKVHIDSTATYEPEGTALPAGTAPAPPDTANRDIANNADVDPGQAEDPPALPQAQAPSGNGNPNLRQRQPTTMAQS